MTRKIVTPQRGWTDINVADLRKAPWNYKRESEYVISKLIENVRTNGFIINVVVRELPDGAYEIIDGNHRLDVLKKLHFETVKAYNLGPISEIKAKKIAVEISATEFDLDYDKYLSTLTDLVNEFTVSDLLTTIPLSNAELQTLDKIAQTEEIAQDGGEFDIADDFDEEDIYGPDDSDEDNDDELDDEDNKTDSRLPDSVKTFLVEYCRVKGIDFAFEEQVKHLVLDIKRACPDFMDKIKEQ